VLSALAVGSTALGQARERRNAREKAPAAQLGVDWARQVIRATGAGAPDVTAMNPAQARLGAEKAAKSVALRNLLEQVKGTSIDGTRTMGDLMERDEVRARVEAIVKGYTVARKRYFSDDGVELEVELPMASLADVVDPDAAQVLAVGKPDAAPSATGLVIDARGLAVTPALMPRVLDPEGKTLYSIDSLSAAARKTSGVAAYVASVEDAMKSRKAGDTPLVVKAVKAVGADLQLSAEDAKRLATLDTSFLADGKVVIVLE
jgi:hypothetical protein